MPDASLTYEDIFMIAEVGEGARDARDKRRDSSTLVSLRNIGKVYANGTVALRGLDLDIGAKEFLSLLGPSGCGKVNCTAHDRRFERAIPRQHYLAGIVRAGTFVRSWFCVSGADIDAVGHGVR